MVSATETRDATGHRRSAAGGMGSLWRCHELRPIGGNRASLGQARKEGITGLTQALGGWDPKKAPSLMAEVDGREAGTIEWCLLRDTVQQEKLLQKQPLGTWSLGPPGCRVRSTHFCWVTR